MTKPQTAKKPVEPLVVPLGDACRLLSLGATHVSELLAAGELDGFWSGRAHRVTMRSIDAYVERQLAAARQKAGKS
jgi:Helix-turn-helix domain